MQNVLLAAEVLVAVALIFIVLLQRSEGGGLGMGSGSAGGAGLFSPRGAADTLTRTTAVLAFLFIAICIGLNLIALRGRPESATSILDTPVKSLPATPARPVGPPAAPSVPKPQ
jgi:preprotein translocase subunit SecG